MTRIHVNPELLTWARVRAGLDARAGRAFPKRTLAVPDHDWIRGREVGTHE